MKRPPMGPEDPAQQKRLIIAIVFSILVLISFHVFYEKPRIEELRAREAAQAEAQLRESMPSQALEQSESGAVLIERDEVLNQTSRIRIGNSLVSGSMSLTGNRIDDLRLLDHYETVERVENVALLSPSNTRNPYYAEFGYIAEHNAINVPDANTQWQIVEGGEELTPDQPLTLRWENDQGLIFERQISIDDQYLFTVTERVLNEGNSPVTLYPYQLISRLGLPDDFENIFIVHQGAISFSNGNLDEISYSKLRKKEHQFENRGGWIGFTDKYWFVSVISETDQNYKARFVRSGSRDDRQARYQADALQSALTILPNSTEERSFRIFAGAKNLDILNAYKMQPGLESLDLSIDFGIWSIITKPLYLALSTLSNWFGHVAWGIIVLTVLIRLVLFPLNNKSFRSMAAMKKIAPQLKEIQEKHKGDTKAMQMKIMELYQREKVNPFSGCWPILLQIPIFFALYKVIMLDIDMRHAPFPGWIEDMSVMDPTSIFNLFGLLPYDVPGILVIGAWPVLMGLTMNAQRRLNPPPTDPIQAKVMTWMPIFFTVILAKFAAGLVIYWTWSNFLGVLQQYVIMRRMGVDVSLVKGYKKSEHEDNKDETEDEKAGTADKVDSKKSRKSKK